MINQRIKAERIKGEQGALKKLRRFYQKLENVELHEFGFMLKSSLSTAKNVVLFYL